MSTAAPISPSADARATLRQLAATLAYRAAKVLRDAPPGFENRTFGDATRRPVLIVAHMADLMAWGVSIAQGGYTWKAEGGDDWETEVGRFFDGLAHNVFRNARRSERSCGVRPIWKRFS